MSGGKVFLRRLWINLEKIRLIDRDKRKDGTGSAVSKATG